MSVGILHSSQIPSYYGPSITVPGSGLALTVDFTTFFADSTVITADATLTP
jgi:hypothetical protein